MIAMIDTNTCNLGSVLNAFARIGVTVEAVTTPDRLQEADAIILPGVGAFEAGIAALRRDGFVEQLRHLVLAEKLPILGICLGMQMLAEYSEEHGHHEGLGLIQGGVTKLQSTMLEYRVPNVGWCDTLATKPTVLFGEVGHSACYYYVHSFHLNCTDASDVAATIEFAGHRVTAAVERDNIFGAQFHPEKSQVDGLHLLENFVAYLNKMDRQH